MIILAVVNGALRDFGYAHLVGPLAAHQISTVTLLVLLTGYMWLLNRIWPITTAKQSWSIGVMWFVLTEVFEFGIGILGGASLSTLLHAYNVLAGQVWIFIPLWVLVAPYLFFRFGNKMSALK
jgi:hypothetical protein